MYLTTTNEGPADMTSINPQLAAELSELLIRRVEWGQAGLEAHPNDTTKAAEVASAFALVYRTLRNIALEANLDPDAMELPLPKDLTQLFQAATDRALSTQEI